MRRCLQLPAAFLSLLLRHRELFATFRRCGKYRNHSVTGQGPSNNTVNETAISKVPKILKVENILKPENLTECTVMHYFLVIHY